MRKLLSGGVLLSLGLVATHAAVEAWIEARAVFALEAMARELPDGARLSWARLDASPLRLAVDLDALRLDLPAGGPVRSLAIGTLRLAQAGGGLDQVGRVASLRAGELVVELAHGQGTLRAARVEGDSVDVQALADALAAADPLAALEELRLGPLRASAVEFDGTAGKARLAAVAIDGYGERELRGLALARLELEGPAEERLRLEELRLGRFALAPADAPADPTADPLVALLPRIALERFALRGFELGVDEQRATLASLALDRAGAGGIERFRLEELRLNGPDGRGGTALVELERADWSRVRLDRLVDAATNLGGAIGEGEDEDLQEVGAEEEAPADSDDAAAERSAEEAEAGEAEASLATAFAGLELLAELARLEVGTVRIERASAYDDRGSGASLELLRWEGLRDRRFGALELVGLAGTGEDDTTVQLERFEQSAVVIAPEGFAERLEQAPRTEEALQELTGELARLPWDSRTRASRFALAKQGRTAFGIERLALTLEQRQAQKRTEFELADLVVDPAVLDDSTLEESLKVAGIDRLQLGARLATAFNEQTLALDLDPLAIEAPGFFQFRTSWFTRAGADPAVDPVTAAMGAQLLRAEIVYTDLGLLDRRLEQMARDARKKRADFAKQLVRDLRAKEPMRSLLDQKRAAELEKFLTEPKTLVIRLAPPAGQVAFMGGLTGLLATPAATAKTIGLQVQALDR